MVKVGTSSVVVGVFDLGDMGDPNLRLRKSIDLTLTKEKLEMVDIVDPHVSLKSLLEF